MVGPTKFGSLYCPFKIAEEMLDEIEKLEMLDQADKDCPDCHKTLLCSNFLDRRPYGAKLWYYRPIFCPTSRENNVPIIN